MHVAMKGGRPIPPGPKIQVNWEEAEESGVLTGHHAADDYYASQATQALYEHYFESLRLKRYSAASKAKRALALVTSGRDALRASWCPTCKRFLHVCHCLPEEPLTGADVATIQAIFNYNAEVLIAARQQRKMQEKMDRKMKRKNK